MANTNGVNPGIINNKDLYIKNKIDNKDEKRNLLISKSNNAYDKYYIYEECRKGDSNNRSYYKIINPNIIIPLYPR